MSTAFDWLEWERKRQEYAERCFADWIDQAEPDADDGVWSDDEREEYDCYEQE